MHEINLILTIKWAAASLFHRVVIFVVLIAAVSLIQGHGYNYGGPPTWNNGPRKQYRKCNSGYAWKMEPYKQIQ